MVHFHRTWKTVCDAHAPSADYAKMKKDCDDYFYLKHRNEARGVGGIFFDYLRRRPSATFAFVRDAGDALPRRLRADRGAAEGRWRTRPSSGSSRRCRRGRYVEFNLVYDRGTIFGLKTRRPHREHPDEPAAGGAVRVRLPPAARLAGGGADRILAQAAGLGGMEG